MGGESLNDVNLVMDQQRHETNQVKVQENWTCPPAAVSLLWLSSQSQGSLFRCESVLSDSLGLISAIILIIIILIIIIIIIIIRWHSAPL